MDTYNIAEDENVKLNHVLFLLDLDMCLADNSPCVNGGTCDSTHDSPRCDCPPGFVGTFCQCKQQVFFFFLILLFKLEIHD